MRSAFTLIELLVVMAIILILASIAIPSFKEYRQKAYDLRASSDLRSVAIAEEAYYLEQEKYLSCENSACADLPGIKKLSDGTTLSVTANDESFTVQASHPKGSGKTFTWNSDDGGLQNNT